MKTWLLLMRNHLYEKLIAPHSQDLDSRRREFILNVLLIGLCIVTFLGFVTTLIHRFASGVLHDTGSLILMIIFLAIVLFSFWLSRKGYYRPIASLLVGLIGLTATYLVLGWSFELPAGQLIFAFTIVLAGVLFRAIIALITGAVVSVTILAIAYLQIHNLLKPDISWFGPGLDMADAIGCVAIFIIIGVVTWLANKEIDNSLDRARSSEAALEIERDNLEVKVIERTRELERAQIVRVMELQRFAEFGRLSAGLLHEMVNPLTAASLNLEQLEAKQKPALVQRAIQSLHHIERYVEAARKQLKSQGNLMDFSINKEVKQIITMLNHRAREGRIKIKFVPRGSNLLYGDPVKFNQLIANLLLNAIESYDNLPDTNPRRPIEVSILRQSKWLKIGIHDWGRGLNRDESKLIFEPFYSTKPEENRNMGIGLAMVKQIVTVDFRGRINVTSSTKRGTRFNAYLRSQHRTKN